MLAVLNLPPRPWADAQRSILSRVRELDLPGAGLLTAAITFLLLVLQWGGKEYPWNNGRVIGLLVGFVVLIIVFIGMQVWLGEKATLPPRIMGQRTVAAGSVFVTLFGASAYLFMYYLPIFFQSIRGSSAFTSGLQLLPILIGLVISSAVTGGLVTAFGFYTPFLIGSTALFAVGAGLITTYDAAMSDATWIGFQVLAGAGLGAGFQVPQTAVQTVLAQDDIPIGSSTLIFFQTMGGTIFLQVGQAVFQNSLKAALQRLAPTVSPTLIFETGATGLKQALEGAGQADAWRSVLASYTLGLQDTFKVSLGLGLGAFLASLFFEWKSVKGNKDKAEPMMQV